MENHENEDMALAAKMLRAFNRLCTELRSGGEGDAAEKIAEGVLALSVESLARLARILNDQ